jgi:hypothetical protein
MDETVVGDHVRHREDPCVPRLGEHVRAHAGQRAVRRDQPVVHPVHPAGQPADTGQVQRRYRGTGQYAGRGARGGQRPYRRGVHPHVGVQVYPGKGPAGLVAQAQRVRLARHGGLDHPYAGLPGERGGAVGARVGDHDDVELAGRRTGEQVPQVAGDDRLFVVRGHHNADDHPHRVAVR